MQGHIFRLVTAAGLVAGLGDAVPIVQSATTAVEAHLAAARAAAGQEHLEAFNHLCVVGSAAQPLPARPNAADRAAWHMDPVKVFDNLYFVGQSGYSAWAVTTSDGIILVDALFDFSVEDEVVHGLTALGLDPAKIKYVLVTHAHYDHAGGAKYLQDRFRARVILSSADWELLDRNLLDRNTSAWLRPKRDMIATDGQRLTLGDTTLTLYVTPGHTPGTISTLIPVKDNGKPHLAAQWGGTGFNWVQEPTGYITADRPSEFWFRTYADSAVRFRDVVARASADVLLSNHPNYDGSNRKLPALSARKAADPHPYVVGNDSVKRYLTVAEECARAGLPRVN
jgi:metallo-beta-lactamase class B